MTQNDITKILKRFSKIQPDSEFARVSRSVILSSKTSIPLERATRKTIFSKGLSFAASVTLTAVFMLVLALGSNAGALKTLFIPTLDGVGSENLVAEADTITQDIEIKLNDIEYFGGVDNAVALAQKAPESEFIAGEDEIDKLLNEVIDY